MKFVNILLSVAFAMSPFAAMSQKASSSSEVTRRGAAETSAIVGNQELSHRLIQRYVLEPVHDNTQWSKVVYRSLDLNLTDNAPLHYPEDVIDGQQNFFRILLGLVIDGKVKAYEYLDGREVFNDSNTVKVVDMLDRFGIPFTEVASRRDAGQRYVVDDSDVPSSEVQSYYIIERWNVDHTSRMHTDVEAVCPVLHRIGDFGGEAVRYPMFWVKLDDVRPHLVNNTVFVGDDDNTARYTYDDYFTLGLYKGEIYKTRNLRNKSMAQLYPDPDVLKRAQDSIDHRLKTWDDGLWVPSRDEVIARNEAQQAAGDSIGVAQRKVSSKSVERRKPIRSTRRSAKPAKKSGSTTAVRSVRRR